MRGDGRFYQDERGYWTVVINLPVGADGKRRRKTIRRKNRAEAVTERRRVMVDISKHGDAITAAVKTSDYLTRWLDQTAATRVRPRTLATYRGYVTRWIIPAIGTVRVDALTTRHVKKVRELTRTGYGDHKPLSSTSALQAHRILAVALRDAVRDGMLHTNPADRDHIEAPRKAVTQTSVLSPEQAMKILAHVQGTALQARWALALLAGLRQGEALGLERSQIDLDAGTLTIQWQLQRITGAIPDTYEARDLDNGYYLTRPKTARGLRVIPLVGPLRAALEAHIDTMSGPVATHDLLFRRDGFNPIHPTTDTKAWRKLCTAAGVPSVRLHDARHTTATLLLAAGVDMRVIQQIMGHSSIAMSQHYAHVDITLATQALERMHRLLDA